MAKAKPKEEKSLKVIRAPKRTIAHDAPSKKFRIFSKLSFCTVKKPSALQQLLHHQDKHK